MADPSLGTIGGGNLFVELQRVEEVADSERFDELELDRDRLWMMVHSGSRGLGHAILTTHAAKHGSAGLKADQPDGLAYLTRHDQALNWAMLNRRIIAGRFAEKLGFEGRCVLDICHNSVTPHQGGWLHRKGAAPADKGMVVIPGSRGDMTYLVRPRLEQADTAANTSAPVAHAFVRRGIVMPEPRFLEPFGREGGRRSVSGPWGAV